MFKDDIIVSFVLMTLRTKYNLKKSIVVVVECSRECLIRQEKNYVCDVCERDSVVRLNNLIKYPNP